MRAWKLFKVLSTGAKKKADGFHNKKDLFTWSTSVILLWQWIPLPILEGVVQECLKIPWNHWRYFISRIIIFAILVWLKNIYNRETATLCRPCDISLLHPAAEFRIANRFKPNLVAFKTTKTGNLTRISPSSHLKLPNSAQLRSWLDSHISNIYKRLKFGSASVVDLCVLPC